MIGGVACGADAELFNRLQCKWMNYALWFGARTEYLEEIASGGA